MIVKIQRRFGMKSFSSFSKAIPSFSLSIHLSLLMLLRFTPLGFHHLCLHCYSHFVIITCDLNTHGHLQPQLDNLSANLPHW